jgi:hypothetical protein
MRVQFRKGQQRKFIELVLKNSSSPSLRSLISRGFDISYSTLKCYYSEKRTLPLELFRDFCIFANLREEDFEFNLLDDNWGKVLGGKN